MPPKARDLKMQRAEARKAYSNNWKTPLMSACTVSPLTCLMGLLPGCNCYLSYDNRKRTLYGDMTRYTCCNGQCPCSGKMGEKNAPELCLCLETVCCFAQSVASTRFALQDEFRLENTPCDNCLIGFMFCMQQLACIFRMAACITGNDAIEEIANVLDCIADLSYCTVCACIQTQHKVQLDHRDETGQRGPMQAPPVQQMPGQVQMQHMQPQPGYPP
eukprot:CAMPEP_0183789574 /NCGR_PEP_ID=MMETSP0803_2-20130417/507_1 /TAXON_ID=195967 /ORGANISM="Crustomastix stigmata, Strain CCMP3273" /LENGTH=216 /DNA_ID=CAMNT_0026033747 /DNA_START=36 /DNA_END=683 /DNA_ORIENTATION=+